MSSIDEGSTGDAVAGLTTDVAWALLGDSSFGRVALSVGGQPDIFPINFYAGDGKILFRTAEGTKLAELTVNAKVAVEADEHTDTVAWSVVAKGDARVLISESEIAAADELPLTPWIPTLKYNYVEITVTEITGRRFEFGPEPERYPV